MDKKVLDISQPTVEMTKRINDIAIEYRDKYVTFIDRLSKTYGSNPFWWATLLGSRDSLLCDCFYNVCLLRYIFESVSSGGVDKIILPNSDLQRTVTENVSGSISIEIAEKATFKTAIKRNALIRNKISYFRIKKRINTIKRYAGNPCEKVKRGERITLFTTYRILSQYSSETYKERYYQGLVDNTDKNIVFMAQCDFKSYKEGKSLAEKLKESTDTIAVEKFALHKDFALIKKYQRWCRRLKLAGELFEGMNIGSLLELAIRDGSSDFNSLSGIIKGEAFARFIEETGAAVEAVYDWYEGQPSSLYMFHKLRNNHPDIPTVAYIQSPLYELNLGPIPSDIQAEQRAIPECFAVQGEAWGNMFKQYSKKSKYISAPSFRYNHVFKSVIEANDSREKNGVLLVLSFSKESSSQMLKAFVDALDSDSEYKIYVKNHPLNDSLTVSDYGISKETAERYKIQMVKGTMDECVKQVHVVLVTESTAVMEIELMGAYTISFIPAGKLQATGYPLDKFEPNVAYDSDDIRNHLNKASTWTYDESRLMEMRNACFTEVTAKSVKQFLERQELI